eukprot:6201896-Pleurochrysis_carterae.AAC.1
MWSLEFDFDKFIHVCPGHGGRRARMSVSTSARMCERTSPRRVSLRPVFLSHSRCARAILHLRAISVDPRPTSTESSRRRSESRGARAAQPNHQRSQVHEQGSYHGAREPTYSA